MDNTTTYQPLIVFTAPLALDFSKEKIKVTLSVIDTNPHINSIHNYYNPLTSLIPHLNALASIRQASLVGKDQLFAQPLVGLYGRVDITRLSTITEINDAPDRVAALKPFPLRMDDHNRTVHLYL